MSSPVQKIKERLSIEEVVSSYIKLENAGSTLKAKCPFHNEKTASFFVSPSRGSYYCFGCNASGDIFTFVEEFEGLDFKGALKFLAKRAGVDIGQFNIKEEDEKEKLYNIMEAAAKFFEKNLKNQPDAVSYLKERGLTSDSIRSFRIGFVQDSWRTLYQELHSLGFKDNDIELAGLIKKTDKGFYDRFRGRIMFPICDSSGRVIAFTGRLYMDDGKSAKYLNSPDTPIFYKSNVLFGLDKAKDSIRKNNFSILVEGQMDLIMSHQAGFKNTIAASGTALSDATLGRDNVVSNLGLVRRLSDNIVLAFDGDEAGQKAAIRAGRIALSLGMDVKVADLAQGVDPADLILKDGPQAWKKVVRESTHLIEFLVNKILFEAKNSIKHNFDSKRYISKEIREKVLPVVGVLKSSIDQMHFVKKISDMSFVPEAAIKEDLSVILKSGKEEREYIAEISSTQSQVLRREYIERKLFGIILWQKSLPNPVLNLQKVLKNISEILHITESDLDKKLNSIDGNIIFEAETFYDKEMNLENEADELLSNLEEEYLEEERHTRMRELQLFEEKKDHVHTREALKALNEINNKIQKIKNSRLINKK